MVEFHVLRCALCQTFQVLQVTKTSKWKCKMCGEKQSIIKVYGQGTGADCRKHVQKLNSIQGCIAQELQQSCLATALSVDPQTNANGDHCVINKEHLPKKNTSRWAHFLEGSGDAKHTLEEECSTPDSHVTTDYNEFQNNKKRKRGETQIYNKWTKYSRGASNRDNTHINYGNKNTHHNLSQETHRSYGLDSHDRPKGNYQINLSGSSETTSEVSELLHCNANTSLIQDYLSQPKKLCSRILSSPVVGSQSNPLSQITDSCNKLSALEKSESSNPDRANIANRNLGVSSLKWAAFLEDDNDEEKEDVELCSDGVSGPVFVTSLNKLCPEDNVSEDEF